MTLLQCHCCRKEIYESAIYETEKYFCSADCCTIDALTTERDELKEKYSRSKKGRTLAEEEVDELTRKGENLCNQLGPEMLVRKLAEADRDRLREALLWIYELKNIEWIGLVLWPKNTNDIDTEGKEG
jgi:hypothetical protein